MDLHVEVYACTCSAFCESLCILYSYYIYINGTSVAHENVPFFLFSLNVQV